MYTWKTVYTVKIVDNISIVIRETKSLIDPDKRIYRGALVIGVGVNEIHTKTLPYKDVFDCLIAAYELYNEITTWDDDSGEEIHSRP